MNGTATDQPLQTPDGRYIVVRGRLWRKARPDLLGDQRDGLVRELMAARRAVGQAGEDTAKRAEARKRVDAAKHALGERGPVWWTDGSPDLNRRMVKNTSYAAWFAGTADGVALQGNSPY